jgi:hypothetical protein
MAVDITTTTNVPGSPPDVTEINDNFDLIKTELDAFPQNGALKAGAISDAAQITNGIITFDKLNSSAFETTLTDVDTAVPTSGAVVDYMLQPRGVFPGFLEDTLDILTGTVEPTSAKAFSVNFNKVICVKCMVALTAKIGQADETWYDVGSTFRASGTDGGRQFGSSWYKNSGGAAIACYANVYDGQIGTGAKRVRWTVFYKA